MQVNFLSSNENSTTKTTCILGLSPRLSELLKKNGEVAEGKKRTNIETSAVVATTKQAKLHWNKFSVIVREFLQNVSDACIRVVENNEDGYHWRTQQLHPNGFAFYLNDKLAAECIVLRDNGTVSLIFYNRGCVMPLDAFQVGSHKLPKQSKSLDVKKLEYIAGGHGIGMKDVITSSFSLLKLDDLVVTTYHPNIEYSNFRSFRMNRKKKKRDGAMDYYAGVYTVDVKDTDDVPKKLPSPCVSLLKSLKKEGTTAGTVVVISKSFVTSNDEEEEIRLQRNFHKALNKHIFCMDAKEISQKIIVKTPSGQMLGYFILHPNLKNSNSEFRTFLFPGLFYCSTKASYDFEQTVSVIFTSCLITTNRDRVDIFENQAKTALGKMIFNAVLAKNSIILDFLKQAFKSVFSDFRFQSDANENAEMIIDEVDPEAISSISNKGDKMMPVFLGALIEYNNICGAGADADADVSEGEVLMVAETIRSMMFEDCMVARSLKSFKILEGLFKLSPRPGLVTKKPMLLGSCDFPAVRDYLAISSITQREVDSIVEHYLKEVAEPAIKNDNFPFNKLFDPLFQLGYRFACIKGGPSVVFKPKGFVLVDKIFYIPYEHFLILNDEVKAKVLFEDIVELVPEILRQVARQFAHEAVNLSGTDSAMNIENEEIQNCDQNEAYDSSDESSEDSRFVQRDTKRVYQAVIKRELPDVNIKQNPEILAEESNAEAPSRKRQAVFFKELCDLQEKVKKLVNTFPGLN